jgi:hypothetical protein
LVKGFDLNWRPVDVKARPATEWPSRQTTITPYADYASLAGHHEKECLRLLGLSVQINGEDIGPHNGCDANGMHRKPSLCALYGIRDTEFDKSVHTYPSLWKSDLLADRMTKSSDPKAYKAHLAEAIYCRKFDMLAHAAASSAQADFRKATDYASEERLVADDFAKEIVDHVAERTKKAVYAGATFAAATRIGKVVADELVCMLKQSAGRVLIQDNRTLAGAYRRAQNKLIVGKVVPCTGLSFRREKGYKDSIVLGAPKMVEKEVAQSTFAISLPVGIAVNGKAPMAPDGSGTISADCVRVIVSAGDAGGARPPGPNDRSERTLKFYVVGSKDAPDEHGERWTCSVTVALMHDSFYASADALRAAASKAASTVDPVRMHGSGSTPMREILEPLFVANVANGPAEFVDDGHRDVLAALETALAK